MGRSVGDNSLGRGRVDPAIGSSRDRPCVAHAVLTQRYGRGAGVFTQQLPFEDNDERFAKLAADGTVEQKVDAGVDHDEQSIDVLQCYVRGLLEHKLPSSGSYGESQDNTHGVADDEDKNCGHHNGADMNHIH